MKPQIVLLPVIHKALRLSALLALWLSALALSAQIPMKDLTNFSDSLIGHGVREKMIPGMVLVLRKQDTVSIKAYGLKNVEQALPADTTTLFQLGSVGKLFTIIAVLQQVEQGTLSLTADVNSYLKDFKVASKGRAITLFDLLTHTAGFDEQYIGYIARDMNSVKPLAEHLSEFMPSTFQPPGLEINYSNYSYALAGHLVECVSEMRFPDYVRQNILIPLGMSRTTYQLLENYAALDEYASGYRTRDTFEPVASFPRHPMPAGSALSSASDMSKLLEELMKPSGKVLDDSSMTYLFQRQFTNHPRLLGYTLGMEEQVVNGIRGVAKGGTSTGFQAELVIFPEQQFGMFFAINTQTDNFLELFGREFLPKALSFPGVKPDPAVRVDCRKFTGVYRSERANHHTVEDLFALYQGNLELSLSDSGGLTMYQNGTWQHYRPIGNLLFQNSAKPEQLLSFQQDASGNISRLHTSINIAGFYVPMSFSPVPWYDNPDFINEDYAFVLLFLLTALLIPLFRLWVKFKRRSDPGYWSGKLISNRTLGVAIAVALLYVAHFICSPLYMARNMNEFYFGVPIFFKIIQYTTLAFPIIVLWQMIESVNLWRQKEGTTTFRVYYTLLSVCAVAHLLFLYRWHFIGLNV